MTPNRPAPWARTPCSAAAGCSASTTRSACSWRRPPASATPCSMRMQPRTTRIGRCEYFMHRLGPAACAMKVLPGPAEPSLQEAAAPWRCMERSQRPTRVVRSSVITLQELAAAGGPRQVLRDRVVRAEHPAAALQGVLTQDTGRLRLAQPDQSVDQGDGRKQGGGVVRAEHL